VHLFTEMVVGGVGHLMVEVGEGHCDCLI
jgi:hypothetical protein